MKSIRPCLLAVLMTATTLAAAPVLADDAEDIGQMQQFIELMAGYYGIIEGVHSIASDPEKAAIQQLQKIEEIYKQRGDRAEAITVLRDTMERTKSPAVRNAAAMMLADALNETGRASEAVKVLRQALEANLK